MNVSIDPIGPAEVPGILEQHFPARFRWLLPQDRSHWFGSGPEYFMLRNPVKVKPFKNLLEGRAPWGFTKLPAEERTPDRIVAWRFTFLTWKGHLIESGIDLSDEARLRTAQVKAVSAALKRFDLAMQSATDLPPWEEPPKFFFATFRGEFGQPCFGHLATTAFFANLNSITQQTVNSCRAELVEKHAALLEPTYVQHLNALLPRRVQPSRHPRLALPPCIKRLSESAPPTATPKEAKAAASEPTPVRHRGHSH